MPWGWRRLMISSHEYKTKSMKVVAEKLRRGDEVDAAMDRVAFKLAARAMMVELNNDRKPVTEAKVGGV